MGDLLTLTPIARADPDCVVEIAPRGARFARFFRGLCKVRISGKHAVLHGADMIGDDHESRRKLRTLGLPVDDYLPSVQVSDEELQRGKELIRGHDNPVAFVSNCSDFWRDYRQLSVDDTQKLVDLLSRNFTVLQFGIGENNMKLKNVVPVFDLPVDDLICCYAAIGRYVGISTGDPMLMLAVGGQIIVNLPEAKYDHMMRLWGYVDCPRATYVKADIEETVREAERQWARR